MSTPKPRRKAGDVRTLADAAVGDRVRLADGRVVVRGPSLAGSYLCRPVVDGAEATLLDPAETCEIVEAATMRYGNSITTGGDVDPLKGGA
jgi:hypothetical protein